MSVPEKVEAARSAILGEIVHVLDSQVGRTAKAAAVRDLAEAYALLPEPSPIPRPARSMVPRGKLPTPEDRR